MRAVDRVRWPVDHDFRVDADGILDFVDEAVLVRLMCEFGFSWSKDQNGGIAERWGQNAGISKEGDAE